MLSKNGYPIYIKEDFSDFHTYLSQKCPDGRLVVITDENVSAHQLTDFRSSFNNSSRNICDEDVILLKPGEETKSLETIKHIYSRLVDVKVDRKSIIIALGGGVVGDISGFVASTFLRGVRYIQVPTTLLSQVDSSIGGKTGVDLLGIKNVIGTFYQPVFVFINVNSLKTLSKREFRSGMAEVVKYSVINSRAAFEYLDANIEAIMKQDQEILENIIYESCATKAAIVALDEKEETGERALLNLGHSFGHAIESASEFRMLHGECVALGMIVIFELARRLGIPVEADLRKIKSLFVKIGLPLKVDYPEKLKIDTIFGNILHDKKNVDGKLRFIIPHGIGSATARVVEDKVLINSSLEIIL